LLRSSGSDAGLMIMTNTSAGSEQEDQGKEWEIEGGDRKRKPRRVQYPSGNRANPNR
jgi:hypothetical protein